MKKLIKTFLPTVLTIFPMAVFAQLTTITRLVEQSRDIVKTLTIVLVGVALLVFFWGIVKYIFAQGSESVKADGKKIMLWGLVALFVMVSVWGIISVLQTELLPGANYAPPTIPTI